MNLLKHTMPNSDKKTEKTSGRDVCNSDLWAFLDRLPMGIFKSDREGNLTHVNDYLVKLMPLQPADQPGETAPLEHLCGGKTF